VAAPGKDESEKKAARDASEASGALDDKAEARKLLADGLYEKCRDRLTTYWLKHPFDFEAIETYRDMLVEIGRPDIAEKFDALLQKRATALSTPPYKHHQELYDMAYALVDIRQYAVAAMLLKELTRELPEDMEINYELGFALMSLKSYEEAIKHFSVAARKKDDFDPYLNLAICYTLLRNLEAAGKAIEIAAPLAGDEDEKLEIEHRRIVLKRLKLFSAKKELTNRDWLFILYGTVLLRPTLKIQHLKEEASHVASMLVVLKGFMTGLSIEKEGVEYYSLRSKPLSSVLAQLSNIPVDAYRGPDRPDNVLLTLSWTTDIIGPHQAFIGNAENRSLFAYALTPDTPLPLVPDIIGCLAEDITMPWEGDKSPKALERLVENILERAYALEASPELIQEYQEAIDYYHDKRDLLVFNNSQIFPNRPEYTAEVPRNGK
jgi:tetratricopeptide (TPR) repeat protein